MKQKLALPTAAAASLADRYARVRAQSLALAAPLSAEDCQVQSMADASPTKWHLAHVTWFFETFLLERFEPRFVPFDPAFRVLFNSYYHGVGEQFPRARRGLVTRPDLAQVKRYRADVDERMQALLASRGDDPEIAALVVLGLEHEQQHQELILTDIKHALWCNPLAAAYAKRWPMAPVRPQPLRWFGYEGGLVELGHDPARDGAFSFDNETPRHRAFTAPFELASRPATFGDYLAFIDDDGYRRPELWLSMGWDWVQSGGRAAPLYWRRDGARWRIYTLQGEVDVDPHTPVCHLSYFEADAFARWSGARLPTEHEWEIAARALATSGAGNFADRGAFHPLPQRQRVEDQPVQMFGDVWEWTQSAYLPYPGYRPAAGAIGEYNGKFMCNQLVLRGGSCATPPGHVRASYRNFFPPEAQWQFSGVRLARDVDAA
jgi:ergothioneine biosynthesis protein EgtB